MANKTIRTGVFRANGVYLSEPSAFDENEEPKYQIQAMFPKDALCKVPGLADHERAISSWESIFKALDEVCMDAFECDFATATAPGMGIQYPPRLADGDTVFEKDDKKNPIPGKVDPRFANMWTIRFKSLDAPGVADPEGNDIDPKAVYSGSWCRAQIEVSAYINTKKNNVRVISIKLLNVQMCYDDNSFGGHAPAPKQKASDAFKDDKIINSNITPGTHAQVLPTQTAAPPPVPGNASVPTPASAAPPPATPVTTATQKKLVQIQGAQYTIEACQTAGWTEDQMVENGVAKWEEVTPPASAAPPPVPGNAPPVANAAAPTLQVAPTAAPAVPNSQTVAPTVNTSPPPAPAAAKTGTVKMRPDAPHTYESLVAAKWTDQQIIDAGYADPDFTQ